ncbi:MAG: Ig-like domain-containing protein [Rhodospirillales bacterium]
MRSIIYVAVAGALAILVALYLNIRESGEESADSSAPATSAPEASAPVAQSPPDPASSDAVPEATPQAEAPAGSKASPVDQTAVTDGKPETETSSGAKPVDEPAENAAPKPPSYDIVRVNPKGDAVIAGRAVPGSTVDILEGDKVIGSVQADRRGEWVFVPDQPLTPGDKQFSLSAETPGGKRLESETVVVMSIPEPGPRPGAAGDSGVVVLKSGDAGTDPAGSASTAADTPAAMRSAPAGTGQNEQLASEASPAAPTAPPANPDAASAAEKPVVVEIARNGGQAARILQGPKEGVRSGDLSLDSINYDEKGNLSIQGQAPEGARVQLYLDNKFVGTAESEKDGKWTVNPSQEVPPGNYTLRVDQVADAGNVRSRLEIPFARAAPIADLPEGSFVIVQPGNSLWRLARRTYGSGFDFVQIYRANSDQILDPDLIYPGQIFTLPAAN